MIYLNDHIADLDLDAALEQLSDQRREQALRYRHDEGRRECAAAFLLLRKGLLEEYGISDMPLFTYGEHGKPLLAAHPDIHFNLSHCRGAVLCALASRPVGADIERVRPFRESLARYMMSDDELRLIADAAVPALAFTRLWTMKEAKLKRLGTGLRSDMKSVLDGTEQFVTVENAEKGYVYSILY